MAVSRTPWIILALSGAVLAPRALAQSRQPRIVGTWRAETLDGPREVVIRPDSSASYGEETVRWRLMADSVFLAFGDEWVGYVVAFRGDRMTVSGGDLEEPMTLRRAGPATPRPDSIPIPRAPPMARARLDGQRGHLR
ncbi:MAG: hypothetical protein A2W29_00400 [Gemmatimonadetes bacterium RBG_16_66_8]|nr:MAG: hypothetical protein A2W29_00400 [Gemmatimonadetes bacterium RBG_16_66_8]